MYAERHGCDLHVCTDFDSSRPASWSKIKFLQRLAADYDYLIWIDADALALPDGPHPARMFDGARGEDFFVALDENGINCGVMGVNCRTEMLGWVWNQTHLINAMWWEQSAIHELHRRDPWRFKVVDKAAWNA